MNKIEIFFSKLFANYILKNEIVATILYVVSKNMVEFKTKIDKTLNTDI
jgi:hypothetical protein